MGAETVLLLALGCGVGVYGTPIGGPLIVRLLALPLALAGVQPVVGTR